MNTVLISYRVRLARNLKDIPFPGFMSKGQTEALLDRVSAVLTGAGGGKEFTARHLSASNALEARALAEQHLISPEFVMSSQPRCVILSRDNSVSVMVNEEDHLRIQAFGKDLDAAWKKATALDGLLDESLVFAFDESLGYLTACPTNLGTALRVSALLHLPALTETGVISRIIHSASQMGLTIRGLYGEGTSARWGYYQISNRITLGVSEEDILLRLTEIVSSIVDHELNMRLALYERDKLSFDDRVWRALGLLTHARRISGQEAMEALSTLRMGAELSGLNLPVASADALLHETQPSVLALHYDAEESPVKRDIARAQHLRTALKGAHIHEQ